MSVCPVQHGAWLPQSPAPGNAPYFSTAPQGQGQGQGWLTQDRRADWVFHFLIPHLLLFPIQCFLLIVVSTAPGTVGSQLAWVGTPVYNQLWDFRQSSIFASGKWNQVGLVGLRSRDSSYRACPQGRNSHRGLALTLCFLILRLLPKLALPSKTHPRVSPLMMLILCKGICDKSGMSISL